MIHLQVHSNKRQVFDDWSELTLQKARELKAIALKLPSHIIELYRLELSEYPDESKRKALTEKITLEEMQKILPELYVQMSLIVSNITKEEFKKMWPAEIRTFYSRFVMKFVLGLLLWPDYQPIGMKSFKHKGVKYYLPASRIIGDNVIPGVELSALEFTEVADLQALSGDNLEQADKVIAILCRPRKNNKVEPYEEVSMLKRAELFDTLTMNVVWEVFFCLARWSIIFGQHAQHSLLEAEVGRNFRSMNTDGTPLLRKLLRKVRSVNSKRSKDQTHTTL